MKVDGVDSAATAPLFKGEYQKLCETLKTEPIPAKEAVTAPPEHHIHFNRLGETKSANHDLAQKIRAIDATFTQVEKNARRMHKLLTEIVKNFPPYPLDSGERVARLRQVGALRRMIEQLTFPPPEKSPEMILADPAGPAPAGAWETTTATGAKALLNPRPLHPGEGGLNIPELSHAADNPQVSAAWSQTAAALELIDRQHRGFVADANRVIATLS